MRKEIWYVIGEDENKNYSLLPTFFETKILARNIRLTQSPRKRAFLLPALNYYHAWRRDF